jgi:hypothetical protein
MLNPLREDPGCRPEDPAAGRGVGPALPDAYQKPDWFTALSICILFATLFVGGSIWWPALALGITAAGILVLYVKSRSQKGD